MCLSPFAFSLLSYVSSLYYSMKAKEPKGFVKNNNKQHQCRSDSNYNYLIIFKLLFSMLCERDRKCYGCIFLSRL